ncbi:hypothetical protein CcCBS67573_g09185, partial [Chytriomyces confervae]
MEAEVSKLRDEARDAEALHKTALEKQVGERDASLAEIRNLTQPVIAWMSRDPSKNKQIQSMRATTLLPCSYFFTTWGTRMDEWAVTLMISAIYPSSLAHISAYSLIITGVSILFGSHVGRFAVSWSESRSRLKIVVASIVVQKVSIAVSAGLLLRLFFMDLEDKTGSLLFFAAVTAAGAAQRLAHRASVIAVEKDWAVVLVRGDALLQTVLNAYLRRVDLVCKLAAPLFVSLVAIPLSVPWTMLVVTAVSLASIPIEILLIRLVFFSSIDLQSHVKESVSAESIVKSGTDELVPLEIYPESQAPNDRSFREHDSDAQISAITITEKTKTSTEAASENEGRSKLSTVSNATQPELHAPIQDEMDAKLSFLALKAKRQAKASQSSESVEFNASSNANSETEIEKVVEKEVVVTVVQA